MINGVEGLFKIDENYTVDKAIVNIKVIPQEKKTIFLKLSRNIPYYSLF